MNWFKKLADLARRAYGAWQKLPDDDKKRIEENAKKISERVLKK
jgi:hypothetical protein